MRPPPSDILAVVRRHRALLLWITIVVIYVPSFSSGFLWDDDDYVSKNKTLTTADGLRQIWFDPHATPQYYPTVHTTYWIEYRLWGLHPAGYHVVNVLLHAAAAVLIGQILTRLEIPGAWLAALIFGIHPVQVESVAWVTERKNVLSAVFYLLSLGQLVRGFHLDGTTQPGSPARHDARPLLIGFGWFILALLSKSVSCSLPAVVVLLILWRRQKLQLREVACLVPFFVVGAAMAMNTAALEKSHVGASGAGFEWSIAERVLIAGRALWFYSTGLVWPAELSFSYPRWSIDTGNVRQWALSLAAWLLPVWLWVRNRRITSLLLALLYFGGTLLPALGFFNIYPMRYSYVADHFQYLASIGIIALASGWIALKSARKPGWIAVSLVAVAALAVLNVQRQRVFHDSRALWDDTLARNPTSMLANSQRGHVAYEEGDYQTAAYYSRRALQFRTDDNDAAPLAAALGVALSKLDNVSEAEKQFRFALSYDPDDFAAGHGLANALSRQRKFAESLPIYRRLLLSDSTDATVILNYANALATAGDLPEAEIQYRRIIELEPGSAVPRMELAKVLARQSRFPEADAACLAALRLVPGSQPARQLLERIRADASAQR